MATQAIGTHDAVVNPVRGDRERREHRREHHEDDGEEKPEQGSDALGAAEGNAGTSQGEKTIQNENGLGQTEARPSGSEHEEAQGLDGEEGGEEKADEPSAVVVRELAQAGAAKQVEIDCGHHELRRDSSVSIGEIGVGGGKLQFCSAPVVLQA